MLLVTSKRQITWEWRVSILSISDIISIIQIWKGVADLVPNALWSFSSVAFSKMTIDDSGEFSVTIIAKLIIPKFLPIVLSFLDYFPGTASLNNCFSMLQPEAGIRIAVFAEGTRFFCGGIHLTHSWILCCSEDEHEENWDSSLYMLFNEEFGRKRFMDSHLKQSRQIMQSGTHDGKIKIPNWVVFCDSTTRKNIQCSNFGFDH